LILADSSNYSLLLKITTRLVLNPCPQVSFLPGKISVTCHISGLTRLPVWVFYFLFSAVQLWIELCFRCPVPSGQWSVVGEVIVIKPLWRHLQPVQFEFESLSPLADDAGCFHGQVHLAIVFAGCAYRIPQM